MIKVLSYNDANPELVELQISSFRKHMKEEVEFIMFNCEEGISKTPEESRKVAAICRSMGVKVIEIPRDSEIETIRDTLYSYGEHTLFGGGSRFVRGVGGDTPNYMLQWIWQRFICKETEPICLVHSDVFLMEPIKLTDYLQDYDLCSVFNYWDPNLTGLWEPFLLANPSKLPEPETVIWWPSIVEGTWTDTGGATYYYLKAHPEIKILKIHQSGCEDDSALDFHPARYQFFCPGAGKDFQEARQAGAPCVLHYQSGSKWCTDMENSWHMTKAQSDEYHEKKRAWARRLIGI